MLAPSGDLATLSGISKPTSASLSVVVDYEDPTTLATTTVTFSTDSRMSLVATPSACGIAAMQLPPEKSSWPYRLKQTGRCTRSRS